MHDAFINAVLPSLFCEFLFKESLLKRKFIVFNTLIEEFKLNIIFVIIEFLDSMLDWLLNNNFSTLNFFI